MSLAVGVDGVVWPAALSTSGNALLEIRDSRLYRTSYGTFEDYCRDRWSFNSSRARQLIAAAETIAILQSDTIVSLLPSTESQTRPLVSLPPEAQQEVWAAAVETAPNGKVTAALRENGARMPLFCCEW